MQIHHNTIITLTPPELKVIVANAIEKELGQKVFVEIIESVFDPQAGLLYSCSCTQRDIELVMPTV